MLQRAPLPVAVLCGLGVGLICGVINGLILTKCRIPAFIVTLGTSSAFVGVARALTNLEAVPVTNETFNNIFGSGNLWVIPTLFLWTILITVIGQYV